MIHPFIARRKDLCKAIIYDCCNCQTAATVRHTVPRWIGWLAIQAQARSHADTHTRHGRRVDGADSAATARIQRFQAHTSAAGRSGALVEFAAGSTKNSPTSTRDSIIDRANNLNRLPLFTIFHKSFSEVVTVIHVANHETLILFDSTGAAGGRDYEYHQTRSYSLNFRRGRAVPKFLGIQTARAYFCIFSERSFGFTNLAKVYFSKNYGDEKREYCKLTRFYIEITISFWRDLDLEEERKGRFIVELYLIFVGRIRVVREYQHSLLLIQINLISNQFHVTLYYCVSSRRLR